jgi:ABC-type polysaccharide/polyol phosphate transport system ATPase subunit
LPTSANGSILVEHVWKRFRADRSGANLTDQMARVTARLRGRSARYRWVLKDVNLELEPGGSLALIGINGSGKSTLLKVISQVTYQTAGRCQTRGRIGALLDVRSGIQPILSGRENIYLYGTVLGLTRKQVSERFDTIVEFAEIENAIDRQVKYYSSGMQVRLGFAIAAYLDCDILLVDEVLAVGDANFQRKCLERISEVQAEGTTLVFVSHDLAAVEAVCDRAMWLSEAVVCAAGPTREVLAQYRSSIEQHSAQITPNESSLSIRKVEVTGPDGGDPTVGDDITVSIMINVPTNNTGNQAQASFYLGVSQGTAMPIFVLQRDMKFPLGEFEVRCVMKHLPLPRGQYSLWLSVHRPGIRRVNYPWRPIGSFNVFGSSPAKPPRGVMVLSPVYVDSTWEIA